ncbi:HpcH/HpaI aldolase family protein [Planctomycetes bacterium K23_9]|uniref:4-hydroxy-2-oxovalerate aldolase n=1 Tax=Stieleria marina TaxID=1930275 RepID=A0A517NT86_9BACT|nr:4-hydroxy-2-oxovalerate aldolase [Planctomycetes bacterium K23_9]
MRKSKSLERVRNGEPIRLAVLGHYIPAYVAHAARAGYDCLWVDLEHRGMQSREIDALLAFGHLFDIDILIRPPTLEKTGLCRYLEDGAAGLMIPHLSTPDLAATLVQYAKFPPIGNRGIDNAGLDADFHVHDPDVYATWANRETFLVAQIETPEAVRNAESIAAVDGVDMLFIGPGDLGLRLRQTNEMTLDEAWETVAAACRKHGKAFGGPCADDAELATRRGQGAQLLLGSSEFSGWSDALVQDVKVYDSLG